MRALTIVVAALLGALLVPATVRAFDAPPAVHCTAIAAPPHSTLSLIAPQVAVNGLPMAIVQASSALSPQAFLNFYVKAWTSPAGKPLFIRYPLGPWQVIAHGERGCFYTVQVQQQGGRTFALIGVSRPGRSRASSAQLDVTAPGDARVLTHMVSEDSGKLGDTWLLYSDNPPGAVARFYALALAKAGWTRITTAPSMFHAGASALIYQKGTSDMGIVVAPLRQGSSITLTVESR